MQILSLTAENIKKLTAVHITPDGKLVQITGKNGNGKTSVLDSIWWCLGGKDGIQATPIRHGEEKAIIQLELGDEEVEYIVTRRFNAKEDGSYTTSIAVMNSDGAKFTSPQKMLEGFLGSLTFDPLKFSKMKPEAQIRALRSLVPDFDFDAEDRANKEDFENRTYWNRIGKEKLAAASAVSARIPEGFEPPASNDALMAEYKAGNEHNTKFREHLVAKRAAESDVKLVEADYADAQTAVKELEDRLAAAKLEVTRIDEHRTKLKDKAFELLQVDIQEKDLSAIEAKMEEAKQADSILGDMERLSEFQREASEAAEKSATLTKNMETRKAAMQAAMLKADLGIEGLDISDGIIKLDGLPFDQASDAMQLRVSLRVAMALNPKLKVIRVRDGSLLDGEALGIVAQMAEENGYQVWMERVDDSGEVGFVLEDGSVKGAEEVQSLLKKPAKAEPDRTVTAISSEPKENVHTKFCNKGEFEGRCKFDEAGCPELQVGTDDTQRGLI